MLKRKTDVAVYNARFVLGRGFLSDNLFCDLFPDLRFPPNTMLMEVQVPIQNSTQCKKLYEKQYKFNVIDDRVVCAGYPKGGKDSCRVR